MRSSRSLPRKSSRRNPAPCHSASRADSATCREWSMSSFVWTFAMVPSNRTRPRGRAAADFVIKLTRCGLLRSAVTREGRAPDRCARQLRGYRTRTRGGPMIGPKMQQALNRHVQAETSSSYLYLAMSAWAEAKAWKGFARWLRVQSDEEVLHARKTLDFLRVRERGLREGAGARAEGDRARERPLGARARGEGSRRGDLPPVVRVGAGRGGGARRRDRRPPAHGRRPARRRALPRQGVREARQDGRVAPAVTFPGAPELAPLRRYS